MPEPGTPALAHLAHGLMASNRCFHGYDDNADDEEFAKPLDRLTRCPMAVYMKVFKDDLKIKLFGRDYFFLFMQDTQYCGCIYSTSGECLQL